MKLFIINFITTLLVCIPTFSQTITTPTPSELPIGVSGLSVGTFLVEGYNSTETLKVSISISNPPPGVTFDVTSTNGVTRDYGYNSWTNITSVNFTGTQSNINTSLSSIKLNTTLEVGAQINLSVVVSKQDNNVYYNPTNGHYYRSVTSYVDYITAKSLASQSTYQGEQGYLVTITSQDEQNFIVEKTSQNNIWIALEDIAQEGYWRVSAGPEINTLIKTSNGQFNGNISGQYNNWCGGEPNNAGNEDAAVTKWGGGGCWNDLPSSGYRGGGYVIEYGTSNDPTQSNFQFTLNTQITFTQNDILYVVCDFNFSDSVDEGLFSGKLYSNLGDSSNPIWNVNTGTEIAVGNGRSLNITNDISPPTEDGTKRITSTGGSVEWCVIYGYNSSTNSYRVGIDSREFDNKGVDWENISNLQLFDLWDGPVTPRSGNNSTSVHWNEYTIYTDTQIDFNNSDYGQYIRNGGSYYALKSNFFFEDNLNFKPQSFIFEDIEVSSVETLIDDIITVSDVVAAFNELSGGGLNGGYKGDLSGVELQNSDVNGDGNFDFQDTQKLLQFLNGGSGIVETLSLGNIMRIIPIEKYNSINVTNWKVLNTDVGLRADINITTSQKVYYPKFMVTWLGDINSSHSITQGTESKYSSMYKSKIYNEPSITCELNIVKVNDDILVTIIIPPNNLNLKGSEFRVAFDNDRLDFKESTQESDMFNFNTVRSTYIKMGSVSTQDNTSLNTGATYKLFFKNKLKLDNTLGLISIIKTELIDSNGNKINFIIE